MDYKLLLLFALAFVLVFQGCINQETKQVNVKEVKEQQNENMASENLKNNNTRGVNEEVNETGMNEEMQNSNIQEVDCGKDMDCFIQKAQQCSPAKVLFSSVLNWFGAEDKTEYYYEIKKEGTPGCSLYLRIEDREVKYSEEAKSRLRQQGLSDDEINNAEKQANEAAKQMIGKEGTCLFKTTNELVSLLNKWKDGNMQFSVSCSAKPSGTTCSVGGDLEGKQCTGSLFSG